MEIPERHSRRHAYHFTSIENLESIIDSGLLATSIKNVRNVSHVNVAEEGIQYRRSMMIIPETGGRSVHNYVPFYFAKKTPMQLAIAHKKNVDQESLIYFSIPISILNERPGVCFSDASANTDIAPNFYTASEAEQLNCLNWEIIDSNKWSYPIENERHQKMAELLVPDQISISEISQIITFNSWVSDIVKQIFKGKNTTPPRIIDSNSSDHYFLDPERSWRYSVITGPFFLKENADDAVKKINEYQKTGRNFLFLDVESAVLAARSNFNVIKELSNIDGLGANYGPHNDDVGTHSRRVAELVRQSPEYMSLSDHKKAILEFAAYLHDIGKGPKSRWENSTMDKPDSNHASRSLLMLQRILTEDISAIPPDSVRQLIMLVTYDDLLGDIAAKGRDKAQLFNIITCRDDIDMLVSLSKADIGSIDQMWLSNVISEIDSLRIEAIELL